MPKDFLFGGASLLKKGLDVYALRQKVIGNNIANLTTPGFKCSRVKFEEILSSKLKKPQRLSGKITHENHIPLGKSSKGELRPIISQPEGSFNGINNVNVEREMTELAKNSIRFETAATLLGGFYKKLSYAIKGR